MLFSEIYSCYFSAVSKVISKALNGELDDKTLMRIIRENAFGESFIDIPEALRSGRWPLILKDNTTVIKNPPEMPLTELEKRWLKSVLSDPRARLFDINAQGLENVKPLYPQDMFVRFDVFSDGDPFDSDKYINNFRLVLSAVRSGSPLRISYTDSKGQSCQRICIADNLEYSAKNDRFRIVGVGDKGNIIINLASVTACELCSDELLLPAAERKKKEIVAELIDVNNALERAMITFSYLEKETSKIDDLHYKLKIKYYEEDEAELLIQVLSFGTNLKVAEPADFVTKLKDRIKRQMTLKSVF